MYGDSLSPRCNSTKTLIAVGGNCPTNESSWIWAQKEGSPLKSDDTSISLLQHDSSGTLTFDMTEARGGPDCNPFTSNACQAASSGTSSGSSSPTGSSGGSSAGKGKAKKKKGLTGGAIAGVVIGCVVGIALITGLAFLWWRKRQNRPGTPVEIEAKPEIWHKTGPETTGSRFVEVMGHKDGTELPGSFRAPVELPGASSAPPEYSRV